MNQPHELRELAGHADATPPFGFEELLRRRAAGEQRRRAVAWSIAGSAGVLGAVALLALLTQRPEPAATVIPALPAKNVGVAARVAASGEPALVDLGQFALTSELEDHIALLDAQISAARVYAASPEQLRQLERARAQLNDSLQRVSYAQTLLNF